MKITLDKKTVDSISSILKIISSSHEVEFRLGSLHLGKFVSGVEKHIFDSLFRKLEISDDKPVYKKVESKVTYYRNNDIRKVEESGKTSFQYKKKDTNIDISFTNIDIRLSVATEKEVPPVHGGIVNAIRIREKNIFSFNGFDIELSRVKNSFTPDSKNVSGDTYEVEAEFTNNVKDIREIIYPMKKIFEILYPDRFYMIPKEDGEDIRNRRNYIRTAVNHRPRNIKRKDIPFMRNCAVTNKLNGVGYEMFLSVKGIHLINSTNIDKLSGTDFGYAGTVIEGEWWKGGFFIFNCLAYKGNDISHLPHSERLDRIQGIIPLLQETLRDVCQVEMKLFINTGNLANDTRDIMRYIYNRFGKDALENNDGIMYQPSLGTPLKFKFPSTMTIDFEITNEEVFSDSKSYTVRVYTRNNQLIPFDGKYMYRTGEKSNLNINPKMVVHKDHPLFNQLTNGLIVECLYNKEFLYFIPERIRWDKKLPNFIEVALDIFKDIIHPIKLEELIDFFEKEEPKEKNVEEKDESSWRIYFNFGKQGEKVKNPPLIETTGRFEILDFTENIMDTLPDNVRNDVLWIEKSIDGKMYIVLKPAGVEFLSKNSKMRERFKIFTTPLVKKGECLIPMRKFHNIKKDQLIEEYVNEDDDVLDLGFGRGGDLLKYSKVKANRIYGVEPNTDNLDEAKRRYADKKNNYTVDVKFINCKAQDTSIINEAMDYKKVDIVASFFSLTFFFEREQELSALINTVAGNTKIGGYFIGTTMSGDEAYKAFKGKSKIEYPGCYKIDKLYEDDGKEEFGKKIVIHLEETIVTEQEEYLVFFDIFKNRMEKRGFELVKLEFFDPPKSLNSQTYDLSKLNMSFAFKRVETAEELKVKERSSLEKKRLKQEEENALDMAPMDKNLVFKVGYLDQPLIRTGTVGDGSCFFHAILKSISPEYSKLDKEERKDVVGKLRNKLADQLTMSKWESFGRGTLSYSRVIPRVVKYIKGNLPSEIFDIAKGLENSKDISTVQGYIDQLLTLIPEDLKKKVSSIFRQLRTRVFEEFKVDLTKCSTWVGQEMGSVDVFEYISDYLNIDIYLIKDTTRAPYRQAVDCDIRYKNRNSVIVLWVGDTHYEAVGFLVEKRKIKRLFDYTDDIIVSTKAYVCPE